MANSIPNLIGTEAALTCTLASLASSVVGVGRQTTIVDLRTGLLVPPLLDIMYSIKLGTTPVAPANIYFYLISVGTGGTTVRTDSAGATDAGLTRVGAPLVWTAPIKASPATGDVIAGQFTIYDPPPLFGLLIVQDTGVALDATGGNHYVAYNVVTPQVQ
jgi:hypothetical protein